MPVFTFSADLVKVVQLHTNMCIQSNYYSNACVYIQCRSRQSHTATYKHVHTITLLLSNACIYIQYRSQQSQTVTYKHMHTGKFACTLLAKKKPPKRQLNSLSVIPWSLRDWNKGKYRCPSSVSKNEVVLGRLTCIKIKY